MNKEDPPVPENRSADERRADMVRLMAFFEIARRANLTHHADLATSPAFQKARELYEAREKYLREGGFHSQEGVDDFFKLHLEGALTKQGKSLEDVWREFAPESLQSFPLPPGTL